jgi:hypothetical protein
MRCFYIAFLVFLFVAASILPPLAMKYAENQQNAVMDHLPPCHQEMGKQDATQNKSPCGQDALRCKCCVVHAALMGQSVYAVILKESLAMFTVILPSTEYSTELLLPPPKVIS